MDKSSIRRFQRVLSHSVRLGIFSFGLAGAALAAPTPEPAAGLEKATFAGGCFWCMETPFEVLPGVKTVLSGYTAGRVVNPSYEQVSAGTTGHTEAVQVLYDPKQTSYSNLLEVFWKNIDPTVKDKQFCDTGSQYRSGIYAHGATQMTAALASKKAWAADPRFSGKTLYPEIIAATAFYPAEDYHQDYAAKNPSRYKFYRWNCGRDQRLKAIWGSAPAH